MSSSENSVNGNGKLFASRRHLYADKDIQPIDSKTDHASVPRHRIAGKQRMPPYIEAPAITVPEPRRARSQSRTRVASKDRERHVSEVKHQFVNLGINNQDDNMRATVLVNDALINEPVLVNDALVNEPVLVNDALVNEPVLVNDALVMVVPKSYLSSGYSTASASNQSVTSKGAKKGSKGARKGSCSVSFGTDTPQPEENDGHILGKKVPPLYVPRPCHEVEATEWESSGATTESDEDENETPWGKRLSAIKVTRVKRDFDEDTVSIEAPEGTLPVCGRCGVVVYLAEEKRAAGRRFHNSCFKCFLCSCSLDSIKLYERNQEVYCKSCYIRQFGPKGFDYGTGEGALRME